MKNKRVIGSFTASAFAAAFALAGCVDDTATSAGGAEPGTAETVGLAAELTAGMSAEGLAIETSTPDHVTGSFERRGVAIRFDLGRDSSTRHALVAHPSGEPIVDATLRDGIESTVFLGGRARVTGPVDGGEPTTEGDAHIFDALNALPEAGLVPELKEALIAQGIDQGLFLAGAGSSGRPGTLSAWSDGTWWHLAYGETTGFFSWAFYTTTTVIIAREQNPSSGFAAAWFQAGFAPSEYVNGYGYQYYYRKWWGAWVTVGNNLLPLCSPSGGGCQNTTMITTHY
jgi:hypothetical protein